MKASVRGRENCISEEKYKDSATIREQEIAIKRKGSKQDGVGERSAAKGEQRGGRLSTFSARVSLLASIRAVLLRLIAAK